MILILEGYYNCTRGSIISKLSEQNYKIIINDIPLSLTEMLEQAKSVTDNTVIVNSWIYQELTYGPNKDPKAKAVYHMIDRILLGKNAIIGLSYGQNTDINKLEEIANFSNLNKFFFSDDTGASVENIISTMETYISTVNKGPGIGEYKEGVDLIIGEQVGNVHKSETKGEYPFASLYGIGYWLTNEFIKYEITERNKYWVNAIQTDGTQLDSAFIKELKPRRIIALGKEAMKWCDMKSLAYIPMPHPSYWKRFHYHKEPYPLLEFFTTISRKIIY